jgi:hypothetical protein
LPALCAARCALCQVAAMLAEMGAAGLGFDPWMLLQRGEVARGHMRRIEQQVQRAADYTC